MSRTIKTAALAMMALMAALGAGPQVQKVEVLRADGGVEPNPSGPLRALEAELRRTDWMARLETDGVPTPYARWLTEDVAWIISDLERAQFRALGAEADRERFIEAFWLLRDPDPATPENRFKKEHYRRIAYANGRFGRDTPGWRTDRGRIYIQLGPPDEIESYPARDFEIWLYKKIPGTPNQLRITFESRPNG